MVWTQLPSFAVGCFTRYSPIPRSIAYKRARRQSVFQLSSYLVRYTFSSKITLLGHMNLLARGMGVELDGPRGLMQGKKGLVKKEKDTVQLRDYRSRGHDENLGKLSSL